MISEILLHIVYCILPIGLCTLPNNLITLLAFFNLPHLQDVIPGKHGGFGYLF